MKKIKSFLVICTAILIFISGCTQDPNKEPSVTDALMDRGYPEEFLNGFSEEVREQLQGKPNLTYEDGLVVSTSGAAKQTYGFADDGTLIDKSVLSSNLDFTVTISHDDIANNYVVTCDYKWLELPDCRGEDPIVALWNPDLFQLVDDSFYRTDKYDTESSTGNVFTDDHGYASASPAGVVWYSDIPERSDATAVYGHCEFVLEPKTIIVGCEIHACYIHALVPANLTISNLQQEQFELGNSDIPHTANSACAEAEVDAVIIEGDPSFLINVPDEQHALDTGVLIQPPSGNCDPEFEIPVNPADTDEVVKNPQTSTNPSDIKVIPEIYDTRPFPIPTGDIYGLADDDAVLYSAVAEYLGNDREELMIPSLTVYGDYSGESGETHYICGLLRFHYYDLEITDSPTYNPGSAGNLARITISADGNCTEIMETLDGADNTERINEICGPLTDLADKLNTGDKSSLQPETLTPTDHEALLAPYLDAFF